MEEKGFIIIKDEEFECSKNIGVGKDRYVPCLKKNAYWLTIDKARGVILWGGEGCGHYVRKVGTEVAWELAIKICESGIIRQNRKVNDAKNELRKISEAVKFLKKRKK